MKALQPHSAHKVYTLDLWWHRMHSVLRNLFVYTHKIECHWVDNAATIQYLASKHFWLIRCLAWLVIIVFHIASKIQYLPTIIITPIFIVIYTCLFFIRLLFAYLSIGLLAIMSFFFMKTHGIVMRCPNCYETIRFPIYICPTCELEHRQLVPSIYGVLSHRCQGCETRLPTLNWLGRKRLMCICPSCRHLLMRGIGEGPAYHIALVGGPSTGKTSYIVTAFHALKNACEKQARCKVLFTDRQQEEYIATQLSQIRRGQAVESTTAIAPQAYTLKLLFSKKRLPALAYIYDPAGKAFTAGEYTGEQTYYRVIDGLILVVDPLAIPQLSRLHQAEIEHAHLSPYPGNSDVVQTYERMMQTFETASGLSKKQRYTQPVAVVVTKTDLFDLNNEIGAPAARALMKNDASISSETEALHRLVRNFLCAHSLDNFVRDVESHFSCVHYFSCSTLSHTPTAEDTHGVVPLHTLDPLLWLFARLKVGPISPHRSKSG